jgi:hypothetical protein
MRHKQFVSLTIALMISMLLFSATLSTSIASAQDNSSLFVGKPVPVVTVKRVAKKGRVINKARPRARVARVPLLAVQLRLLKLKTDGTAVETNPLSQFYANDRLRLSVKANQDGYLTIIRQSGPNEDGQILFPTSLLNDGANYVTANKEFVVPSNCPANVQAADCAYVIPESAGTQIFTVIFSRDLIMDLPESAKTATGAIKAQLISEIESNSIKQLEIKPGASPYAILVLNTNREDNEEIFTRFGVTSRGPSPLQK